MRKTISILAMAAAVLCSCDKNADCVPCDQQETGTLAVSLLFDEGAQTKAVTSFTTSQTYEKQVNKVQIFVFDESGKINIYKDAGTTQSNISISTTTGKKTIWAVVNGPDLSEVASLAELEDTAIDLAANSTTAATGFVMAGSTSCTVSASAATANISVSRLVARVALQKVTNQLPDGYGALTIDNVVLTNVAGNQNIAGDATPATWYNKMGRKDGATAATQIIDGSTNAASCPTLTFAAPGASVANGAAHAPSTPHLFYCFPNSTSTDKTGFESTFTARKTRLVVAATINSTKYYYPVVINTPERNKAYTVELTITGLGSTDPDQPVSKGAITAAVTVQGWQSGATYEETI
mgnify:CR=1 FL=1